MPACCGESPVPMVGMGAVAPVEFKAALEDTLEAAFSATAAAAAAPLLIVMLFIPANNNTVELG